MMVNLSSCSARIPIRSSLCVLAFFFFSFFFVRNILVSDSSGSAGSPVLRLTGHELYVIPVLKQTIFFSFLLFLTPSSNT